MEDDDYCKKCGKKYTNLDHKWCRPCQKNHLKENFTNWTSGNEEIDNLIQITQLNADYYEDMVFEWIPYEQFNNIKEMGKNGFVTYSATWKDGPLCYNVNKLEFIRECNEDVALKYSQNVTTEFLNEVKSCSFNHGGKFRMYGISQNPDTKDYIMVLENQYCEKCGEKYTNDGYRWCNPCQTSHLKGLYTNWTSENGKIDDFIKKMQLKIKKYDDIIFEWIPYDQLNNIKETAEGGTVTHLATWKNGPLSHDMNKIALVRKEYDKKVALKCLYNSQNITDESLNEVKNEYSINCDGIRKIYGISQNSDTKDYVIVLEDEYCEKCSERYTETYCKWCKPCLINYLRKNFTSGNEKIDNLIQEIQSKIYDNTDVIFEWIPYNQFDNIKEIISKSDFVTIYSAIWKDGPLNYDYKKMELERIPDKKVTLKYFSQNIINEFLTEVKSCSINYNDNVLKIHGISQNPDTKNYIIVFQDGFCEKCGERYTELFRKWCQPCQINYLKSNFTNWTSGNKKIDDFIQGAQSKTNDFSDIVFEWIPYNKFYNIKEIGKGGFATVYSAIWKGGPLKHDSDKMKLTRASDKIVALKCLHNSQNISNEFLNEVKAYSISRNDYILKIFGMSQNPDTKDYIMVLQYAGGGNLNDHINETYKKLNWKDKIFTLMFIIEGLKNIHDQNMVHRDFHTGNILLKGTTSDNVSDNKHFDMDKPSYISDMGLSGEVGNIDEKNIYGIMPYVAPEVLRGKPYTQAADIYSFGMIMYFIAIGKQPFSNCAHDYLLTLNICNGIRPEINEPEAPKCFIDLIKKCWDSNLNNRPNAIEVEKSFKLFSNSYIYRSKAGNKEIEKQFNEAEKYRKANIPIKMFQSAIDPQAIYTSRLLNPSTKDLSLEINNNSTVIDFTK